MLNKTGISAFLCLKKLLFSVLSIWAFRLQLFQEMKTSILGFPPAAQEKLSLLFEQWTQSLADSLNQAMSQEVLRVLTGVESYQQILLGISLALLSLAGSWIVWTWVRDLFVASAHLIKRLITRAEKEPAKSRRKRRQKTEVIDYSSLEGFEFPASITSIRILAPSSKPESLSRDSPAWKALNKGLAEKKTLGDVMDSAAEG